MFNILNSTSKNALITSSSKSLLNKLNNKSFSSNINRITFVGLGNMGLPMAQNLLKSGVKVAGFDFNQQSVETLRKSGACAYQTLESALKESEALITMLPNAKAVKTVWEDAEKFAKKNTIFIDSSTISPIDAANFAKQSESKGFLAADAPVSGGVMGATKATLSFMIGSKKDHFEQIKSILVPMGKNFFYCGENSSGQIAKTCNNLCLGITMAGLSESLALGVKLGIDAKVLSEIMAVSSGRCWSLDTYNPIPNVMENVPSSRNYENGFSMELITKDINIALDCAKKIELDMELSHKTQEHYEKIKEKGFNNKDFSFVYQYILNNKKI
jgi:3-hydroxyisobutyrate dehydrogenase